MYRITSLHIFPVKSCRGIELQEAYIADSSGFRWDRQWVIVRQDNYKFITQRQLPKLALLQTALPKEALAAEAHLQLPPGAALTLSAPGAMATSLEVPLVPFQPLQTATVTVWYWTGTAADEGDAAAAWLSEYCGIPVRLFRYIGSSNQQAIVEAAGAAAPSAVRHVAPEWERDLEFRFADQFPLMLATQASLADLNDKLQAKGGPGAVVPMSRFRPNIIVEGSVAWEEDTWMSAELKPGATGGSGSGSVMAFTFTKPRSRCKITTTDQGTAAVSGEPLDTLMQFRSGPVMGWAAHRKSWTHECFFGWDLFTRHTGRVAVGDALALTAVRTEPYVPPADAKRS